MLRIHKRDCTNTIEVPILGKVYAESPSTCKCGGGMVEIA